jgi:hypothetical protein
MADRYFKKEDFVEDRNMYRVEFKMDDIGEGVDLVIERKNENGEYEVIQADMTRHNESLFLYWSEPFDGRIVSDEYKTL